MSQKTFDEIYQGTHSMLYHKDDTHWNALGAKTTAESARITDKIKANVYFPLIFIPSITREGEPQVP